ncbi:hypothetical protein AB0J71_47365 [Nonomuraea sp. NPDC049637]|uniref:hypothetical protein n=1 Tax=Nonomuraea sp. NPDC049637 TaxID=3154356 RepID=UPI0034302F29
MASFVPAVDNTDPAPVININPSLTADQRQCVEQSVAQMIARHREAITRRRADEAEQLKPLRDANKALAERLANHPDAALVLEALRTNSRHLGGMPTGSPSLTSSSCSVTIELREGLELFGLPFDFDWHWQDSDGGNFAPRSVSRETGIAKIHAGISSAEGDATWITGHAGVGVVLSTETEVAAVGRALRSTKEKALATGGNFGSDATSEGGTEITVMRGDTFVTSATDKRWRLRCSGADPGYSHDNGGFGVGDPISVAWAMLPGSIYTLNVGAWVYAEAHAGFPLFTDYPGKAICDIEANLPLVTLIR